MKHTKRLCRGICLGLTALLLCACAQTPAPTEPVSETTAPTEEPVPVETAQEKAERLVSQMTVEEKIGQVIMPSFRNWITQEETEDYYTQLGIPQENRDMMLSNEDVVPPTPHPMEELNEEVKKLIRDYRLNNIILFAQNCSDVSMLTHLTYDLQQTVKEAGLLPMLISIDQEGGSVIRIASGCCLSGNMALGSTGDPENARTAGSLLGREMKAVGVNCDFAPVADVNSNPANPVIGTRSFSADPQVTAKMAAAMSAGLQEQGIISCAKHFPGHGNTSTDSHVGLPMVDIDHDAWLEQDGLPFKALVEAGIPMIMTAHIQYPGLDDTKAVSKTTEEEIYLPATLSHRILTQLLREEMGYQGVIVTDAMNMKGISDHFGAEEAAMMALNAGADLLCMPVSLTSLDEVNALESLYEAIRQAVADGTLTRLDEAAANVVRLKIEAGLLDADYDYDVEEAAKQAVQIVGGTEDRALERQLARECVHLEYKNEFQPFAPESGSRVLVMMPYDSEIVSAKYAMERLIQEHPELDFQVDYISYQNMKSLKWKLQKTISKADYLILGSEQLASVMSKPDHWLNQRPKDILAAAKTKNIAILCTELPYQASKYKKYPCFLLYNYVGMSEDDLLSGNLLHKYGPAIPAGIEAVFGF